MRHREKGINISHVNIENMGGRDQSQVKVKFKKISPFQIYVPKVIPMTVGVREDGQRGSSTGSGG